MLSVGMPSAPVRAVTAVAVPEAVVETAVAVVVSVATVAEVLPAVLPVEVLLAVVTASLVAAPVVDVAALPPLTPTTPVLSPAWAASKRPWRSFHTQNSAGRHTTTARISSHQNLRHRDPGNKTGGHY